MGSIKAFKAARAVSLKTLYSNTRSHPADASKTSGNNKQKGMMEVIVNIH